MDKINIETVVSSLSPAENHYKNHLKAVAKYQKTHPEQNKIKSKKAYEKLKNDPEKYQAVLEKRKLNYRAKKEAINN